MAGLGNCRPPRRLHRHPHQPFPQLPGPPRWEALVPVAPGVSQVEYRYKLEWQYNAIPTPQNDSQLSKKQVLHILDNQ